MAREEVSFNTRAFWQNIQGQKCKKKLKGALKHLEREMKKGSITEDMFACKMFLDGKIGNGKGVKLTEVQKCN